MKRGLITVLVLVSLAFSFVPCLGQEVAPEEPPPEKKFTSLHKSLLFPGWGQLAEKRYIEGVLFLSAEIFALYKVLTYNQKGNTAYAWYKDATSVADAVQHTDQRRVLLERGEEHGPFDAAGDRVPSGELGRGGRLAAPGKGV